MMNAPFPSAHQLKATAVPVEFEALTASPLLLPGARLPDAAAGDLR
ncbi:hypothetical protein [Bradyrhizobium sp. BWC-3-1]|nr:hypothetical protein [Bradyrhizobium sp. BWC-3-1]WOH56029.1 hypothetical protein RX329_27615 [Bradyrhizobium sp. BWC-3-1]